MIFSLLQLEIKSILRSPKLKGQILTYFIKFIFGIYLALILLNLSLSSYKLASDNFPGYDPLYVISGFFIFYWLYDLGLRFMFINSPIVNIKPLLVVNIKRKHIIIYSLFKGYFIVYNLLHLFYFIPLFFVLISKGYSVLSAAIWSISLFIILTCNSFLSILLDKINKLFYVFVAIVSLIGLAHFKGWINIFPFIAPVFYFFYQFTLSFLVVVTFLVGCIFITYKYYLGELYLDKALKIDAEQVKTINFSYLNTMGTVGAFIKNDIYLILRNKRARATVLTSLLFIFYPFLFGVLKNETSAMMMFGAIFATGGFMMSFGQYVPSWDSSYYPLLMTRNISLREYLLSKWYILAFSCIINLVLCSFYFFISPMFYYVILASAIFNIGFNTNIVLFTGIYTSQHIDLSDASGAFGNTKSFNINTLVLSLITLVCPLIIYALLRLVFNDYIGIIGIATIGIFGVFFREKMFLLIIKKYSANKYKSLIEFKK